MPSAWLATLATLEKPISLGKDEEKGAQKRRYRFPAFLRAAAVIPVSARPKVAGHSELP
jgi:hypothetical protein